MVVLHPHDRKWLCPGSIRFEGDTKKPWSLYIHVGETLSLFIFVCFSLLLFCCCCLFALSSFTIKRKHKKGCMKCYPRCHRLFMRGFRHVFSRASGTDSDEMPAFDSMNSPICLFCTNNVHVILF